MPPQQVAANNHDIEDQDITAPSPAETTQAPTIKQLIDFEALSNLMQETAKLAANLNERLQGGAKGGFYMEGGKLTHSNSNVKQQMEEVCALKKKIEDLQPVMKKAVIMAEPEPVQHAPVSKRAAKGKGDKAVAVTTVATEVFEKEMAEMKSLVLSQSERTKKLEDETKAQGKDLTRLQTRPNKQGTGSFPTSVERKAMDERVQLLQDGLDQVEEDRASFKRLVEERIEKVEQGLGGDIAYLLTKANEQGTEPSETSTSAEMEILDKKVKKLRTRLQHDESKLEDVRKEVAAEKAAGQLTSKKVAMLEKERTSIFAEIQRVHFWLEVKAFFFKKYVFWDGTKLHTEHNWRHFKEHFEETKTRMHIDDDDSDMAMKWAKSTLQFARSLFRH